MSSGTGSRPFRCSQPSPAADPQPRETKNRREIGYAGGQGFRDYFAMSFSSFSARTLTLV
jgi:hypothetical protein